MAVTTCARMGKLPLKNSRGHPRASQVAQYRPITIFSVAYRCWSSIRAKQLLTHLSQFAPPSCAGNLPHKSTCDVWHSILSAIEMSHHTGQELAGSVVDLVKCFNLLPRFPVLKVMQPFGVANEILCGWASAQVAMKRRFELRSCTGPGISSVTGFAEGCALSVTAMLASLSVTAMLAVDLVVHKWMSLKYPNTVLYSFVDNLELLSPNADEAIKSLEELLQFTAVLDVQIDHSKTYLWSTQSGGRKVLRSSRIGQNSYRVAHHARQAENQLHTDSQTRGYARPLEPTGQKHGPLPAKTIGLKIQGMAAWPTWNTSSVHS